MKATTNLKSQAFGFGAWRLLLQQKQAKDDMSNLLYIINFVLAYFKQNTYIISKYQNQFYF